MHVRVWQWAVERFDGALGTWHRSSERSNHDLLILDGYNQSIWLFDLNHSPT